MLELTLVIGTIAFLVVSLNKIDVIFAKRWRLTATAYKNVLLDSSLGKEKITPLPLAYSQKQVVMTAAIVDLLDDEIIVAESFTMGNSARLELDKLTATLVMLANTTELEGLFREAETLPKY